MYLNGFAAAAIALVGAAVFSPLACGPTLSPTTGACCLDDTCTSTDQGTCHAQGGVFLGVGRACGDIDCGNSEVQGCCSSGDCTDMTEVECISHDSAPLGAGTSCATTDCDGNPIPGACCHSDNTCSIETSESCDALGGVFKGANVTCESADCAFSGNIQACCIFNQCNDLSVNNCNQVGGVSMGFGTTCADTMCN